MQLYLEDDETELAELTVSVLGKLGSISDEDSDSLDLFLDFENFFECDVPIWLSHDIIEQRHIISLMGYNTP